MAHETDEGHVQIGGPDTAKDGVNVWACVTTEAPADVRGMDCSLKPC